MINFIRIRFYRLYNRWFFRRKGITFGSNMMAYNKVYLTGYCRPGGGACTIGNNFHLTSGDAISPYCRNIRACIHLGSPKAVITIGNNVGMSSPCMRIQMKLTIGNHVNIGGNCIILDTDGHQIDYLARRHERDADPNNPRTIIQSAPITIEDDVWIGANCIIMKGVTIGARSVIGAGSVVTKSIPADYIAAGNPCRVVKAIPTPAPLTTG